MSLIAVMPDSLTRWRITGRGLTVDGTVGQRTAYVRSARDLYVKWTSPTWMRQGDQPWASLAIFNQTERVQIADLQVSGPGVAHAERLTLKPGATFTSVTLAALTGDGVIRASLSRDGRPADSLETRFTRLPAGWRSPHSVVLELNAEATPLSLPPDARDVRVTLVPTAAAQFGRVIDDLLDYPYGCIEQSASRMIPFALAIEALGADAQRAGDRLRQQLAGQRLRLAYMAGPQATFTWWGADTTDDPFLTAYAYYADALAVRALGLELPHEHWSRLNDVYAAEGYKLPPVQRALMLRFMRELELPVQGLVEGLLRDFETHPPDVANSAGRRLSPAASPILADPQSALANALAWALADDLARSQKLTPPSGFEGGRVKARAVLETSAAPIAHALLAAAGGRPDGGQAVEVLRRVTAEMPTLERALTLVWTRDALGGALREKTTSPTLAAPWVATPSASGGVRWTWPAGQAPPDALRLAPLPGRPLSAVVQFDSATAASAVLPVSIQRRFYRVKKADANGYELQPLHEGQALSTDELYLDEVQLAPQGRPTRYALLELALPPGASLEGTTWGIDLRNAEGQLEGLERARGEATPQGYVVPLDPLAEPAVLRHLVRFAQRGSYVLPRGHLFRMYQPDARAVEAGGVQRLEVR